MIAGLSLTAFAIVSAAIFCGTIVQRLSGQAYGMIAAPVMALVAPQHLPAAIILLGVMVGAGAISMDMSAVNWREAGPGFAGRAAGAGAGAAIAAASARKARFFKGPFLRIVAMHQVFCQIDARSRRAFPWRRGRVPQGAPEKPPSLRRRRTG